MLPNHILGTPIIEEAAPGDFVAQQEREVRAQLQAAIDMLRLPFVRQSELRNDALRVFQRRREDGRMPQLRLYPRGNAAGECRGPTRLPSLRCHCRRWAARRFWPVI